MWDDGVVEEQPRWWMGLVHVRMIGIGNSISVIRGRISHLGTGEGGRHVGGIMQLSSDLKVVEEDAVVIRGFAMGHNGLSL